MPTKILVLETQAFQLGANAGSETERLSPMAFSERLRKHREAGTKENLFVIAPEEVRFHTLIGEAIVGPGTVVFALFGRVEDCVRLLPSLPTFYGDSRSVGLKDCLAKGSTIYSQAFFNGKNVGSKLDPAYALALRSLSPAQASRVWGCLQSLVILGLQYLPDVGERGTGEKVDVQIGCDDRHFAVSVRFNISPEQAATIRANPILNLPRSCAGVFESRFLAESGQMELNCLFYRQGGPELTVEITGFVESGALENAEAVGTYQFKGFENLEGTVPEDKRVLKGKGGFRKKFSEEIDPATVARAAEAVSVISPDSSLPQEKVVVSGNANLGAKETVIKGGETNPELEAKVKALESGIKIKDEMISKLQKELSTANDPLSKRDVISNIKDAQSEGLKQTIKTLETELDEAKGREKELMKMVDKAVQMKDEAAKKIKELDMKLKQAGGQKGSKEQMLEKQLEEQKRQNKELSAKVTDLMNKLQSANKRVA